MAGEFEYDVAGMRAALTALHGIAERLEDQQRELGELSAAPAPGEAPATARYHQRYLDWAREVRTEHAGVRKQAREAIEALTAIDRAYNDGELASELGLRAAARGGRPPGETGA